MRGIRRQNGFRVMAIAVRSVFDCSFRIWPIIGPAGREEGFNRPGPAVVSVRVATRAHELPPTIGFAQTKCSGLLPGEGDAQQEGDELPDLAKSNLRDIFQSGTQSLQTCGEATRPPEKERV